MCSVYHKVNDEWRDWFCDKKITWDACTYVTRFVWSKCRFNYSYERIDIGRICIYGIFMDLFILDENVDMYDFLLPKGFYLSLYYRDDYNQTPSNLQRLLSYAKAHGYEIL